jgi:hypothetical protein
VFRRVGELIYGGDRRVFGKGDMGNGDLGAPALQMVMVGTERADGLVARNMLMADEFGLK